MTEPFAQVPQHRPAATATARAARDAAVAVAQRILLLDRCRFVRTAPQHLDPQFGGLVLCGSDSVGRVWELREGGFGGILLADPGAYEKQAATPDEPFALPDGVLFGGDLEDVLQDQVDRGATSALTPSRYVHAGDSDALKGLMRASEAIERSDIIVTIPVAIAWLRDEHLRQLIAIMQRISHPKALVLGGQYNPLSAFRAAPNNLRTVVRNVPNVGLWRTDLAAFDCLAYGGLFAAIGAGGSLRHLVPADQVPQASRPRAHFPAVLFPEMLRFSRADWLAERYANVRPPRCECAECGGGFLDRFNSRTGPVRAAAHAHNAATWNNWLPDLFDHNDLGGRQAWWRGRCKAAVDAHELENVRIRQPGAFKPSATLEAWATLPLNPPPGSVSSDRNDQHPLA